MDDFTVTCEACENDNEHEDFCEGCSCCSECCNCTETDCDCDACTARRENDSDAGGGMPQSDITNRGFRIDSFTDSRGVSCSLQESSLASEEGHVWLGCDDIGLKRFTRCFGWQDVDLEQDGPGGVLHRANTRMHLSQSQVQALLPALQYFAEHGVLPAK